MRLRHEDAQVRAFFDRTHHVIRLLKPDVVAVGAALAQFFELLGRRSREGYRHFHASSFKQALRLRHVQRPRVHAL